jgi:hypothetical protein
MILKVQKLQLLLSLAYYVTAEVANMAAAPKRKWLLSFDLRSAARRSHPTLGRVTALDRKKYLERLLNAASMLYHPVLFTCCTVWPIKTYAPSSIFPMDSREL